MGPPPFGDGNDELLATSSLENILQWGHRLSAMETTMDRVAESLVMIPSMGPPPFGDGNSQISLRAELPRCVLQWGHRLSAMETARAER